MCIRDRWCRTVGLRCRPTVGLHTFDQSSPGRGVIWIGRQPVHAEQQLFAGWKQVNVKPTCAAKKNKNRRKKPPAVFVYRRLHAGRVVQRKTIADDIEGRTSYVIDKAFSLAAAKNGKRRGIKWTTQTVCHRACLLEHTKWNYEYHIFAEKRSKWCK